MPELKAASTLEERRVTVLGREFFAVPVTRKRRRELAVIDARIEEFLRQDLEHAEQAAAAAEGEGEAPAGDDRPAEEVVAEIDLAALELLRLYAGKLDVYLVPLDGQRKKASQLALDHYEADDLVADQLIAFADELEDSSRPT